MWPLQGARRSGAVNALSAKRASSSEKDSKPKIQPKTWKKLEMMM
jgi:hypothetical protein